MLNKLKNSFPLGYRLFMKIAEPRVVRLVHFGIYIAFMVAGISIINYPPSSFQDAIGDTLMDILGAFIFLGATFGALAVLPGIWWLERTGILALGTGMAMSIVVTISVHAPAFVIALPIAFIMTYILRWIEIRRYQLAPREE